MKNVIKSNEKVINKENSSIQKKTSSFGKIFLNVCVGIAVVVIAVSVGYAFYRNVDKIEYIDFKLGPFSISSKFRA